MKVEGIGHTKPCILMLFDLDGAYLSLDCCGEYEHGSTQLKLSKTGLQGSVVQPWIF